MPAGAARLGALAGSTTIRATVTLKPAHAAALSRYAEEVSTRGTSVYHHYLTTREFAARFGPSHAQIRKVEAYLKARGLHPGAVTADHLALSIHAPARTMAAAFDTSFSRYRLDGGRIAYANAAAPRLSSSVAGIVQGVIGLDSLNRSTPQDPRIARAKAARGSRTITPQVSTGGPQPCSAATSAASSNDAYTADQLASYYDFSGLYGDGDLGSGETVALYELEPNLTSDISAFQSCYGTDASVSYDEVDGGSGTGAGEGEAALDIEDVISLAPDASVDVYQGPNSDSGAYDTYNAIISADTAQVVSTSWGQCESSEGSSAADSESTLFQEAATQGQTIVAAAGDSGSEDCGTDSLAVDDPASQPYVTGVGGTSLNISGDTETVWNDSSTQTGAGGGGISSLWSMPSYQSGAPSSLDVINSNSSGTPCSASSGDCREVPDVSADADPYTGYTIYYNGAWTGIGGTSAAAPLWAALFALTDASTSGCQVGFANTDLYSIAGGSDYSSDFNDITSGNNDYTGTNNGLYPAETGYSMASGLGTPIAASLASDLCAS